ncbi:TIGR03086 family metal-binding protein [Kribbella sp.]|uniref:TIGR03086 family metal-binding protein n=1 Tax=Kribbella sp. TaxID=1871183 RepID=UPI002D331B70|nr:TIGR03086 family metal-binding protein [Kribbella sp.]HZX02955.1 TIGR03086 family metal-binding protein [Kribbella sp.]
MTFVENDPRPLFVRALNQTQQLVTTTSPDHLTLPTPCDEYDVSTLQGHLLSVLARINLALQGGDPLTIPVVSTGVDDVPTTWKERRAALDATLADDAVLGRTCKLPWGTLPGAAAIAGYTGELTTHSWDLAKATGRLSELDDAVATQVLPMVQQFIPADQRGGHVPFEPVVQVADDASPYDQLAAWQGRQP